tara:strand:- start:154 stop:279 length:126 start_codon:yes stop_codon:yes gene_type:complete
MSEVRNGKGDSYRIPVTDKKYKENYNKIFQKKDEQKSKRQH